MQRSIFDPSKSYEVKTTADQTGNTIWNVKVVMARYYSFIEDDIKKFSGNDRLVLAVTNKDPICLEFSATYRKSDNNIANNPLDSAIRSLLAMLNKHHGVLTKDYVELVRAHEDFLNKNNIQSDYHAKVAKQHGGNYRPHGNAY